MLIQLHWQKKDDLQQTILVAQDEILDGSDGNDAVARLSHIALSRRSECPEGYMVLFCTEGSEYMVYAAKET